MIEEKTLELKRILEISLRKEFMQRRNDLGTIVLATAASSASRGKAISGIQIFDVRDPETTYRKVKDLVAAAKMHESE